MNEAILREAEKAYRQAEAMATSEMDLTHLRKIATLALLLMDQHGLHPGQSDGWSFTWDRAWQRAGMCIGDKKTLSFSLSLFAIWTREQCANTILHEIAHALVPDGVHSHAWQLKAIQIGCDGRATWGGCEEAVALPANRRILKYQGVCPEGHIVQRTRLPKNVQSCGVCSRRYDNRFLLTWTKI